MFASAIRELAASRDSTLLAAALFESRIQIWDIKSANEIGDFQTQFCAGARNLALAPGGEILVAGKSDARGEVAAYEVPSGRMLWSRKLVYPSSLRFDFSGQSIWCTDNRKSVLRLEMGTGSTVQAIDGVIRYIEGRSGDVLMIPSEKQFLRLIARGNTFSIDRASFAVLDAQFSPHTVCIAEAKGPVRCISCEDGTLQWMCDLGPDSHISRLYYSTNLDIFFGIVQPLNKNIHRRLVRFDFATGEPQQVRSLDSWEETFVGALDQLVTSSGEIIDLLAGTHVGQLTFPRREYGNE